MPEMNALGAVLVEREIRFGAPMGTYSSLLCHASNLPDAIVDEANWDKPFKHDLHAVDSATAGAVFNRGISASPRIDKIRFVPIGRS